MSDASKKLQSEVFFQRIKSLSLSYSAKSLKVREESEEQGYGVRVYSDGGLGFSFTSDEKKIDDAMKTAAGLAKYCKRKNFSFPEKANARALELADEKIKSLSAAEVKAILEQIRDGAEKYGGNSQISIEKSVSFEQLQNTNGFFGEYETTELAISVEVMDGDGYGFFSNSFGRLSDVKDFYDLGIEAAEMARAMRNPKKPEPGRYIVVFEPDAVASLFDILLPSFNGDLKRRKISFLHDKEGEECFWKNFSLYDDPLLPYSPSSFPFDGDGIIAQRKALVENGVVKNFAYNLETASLEGVKKSGFAVRSSYFFPPAIGFSNLVVEKGDMEDYVHPAISVLAFHGTHTANTTTGDFGVEVSVAFNNAEGDKEPLRGFMISGNIFNLFRNIYGIGKTAKNVGGVITPKIAFSDVSVIPS